MDTMMDTTVDFNESNIQKSCIAQRTRSQTELLKEKATEAMRFNLSELKEKYEEMREVRDKSKIDDSWEYVPNKAIDSMNLPPAEAMEDLKVIYRKIEDINDTLHNLSSMEESFKAKKGVSWSNKDTVIEGKSQPIDRTFVIEDPRYGNSQ